MRAYKENHRGHDFLVIELEEVLQKGKTFYLAKIPAKYFLELYTVKPTKYDIFKYKELASKFEDGEDYFNYLVGRVGKEELAEEAERELDPARVKDIKKFLEEEEYALFPNTIIAACDLINNEIDIEDGVQIEPLIEKEGANLPYLMKGKEDDTILLYVPYERNSILVLDGQHRLAGLEEAENIDKEKD